MEEKNIAERIKDAFRSNFGYLAVILVSVSYVATSFMTLATTGKNVFQIISDGVLSFVVGILINRMFETQGVINGDADPRVIRSVEKHAGTVEEIAPYLDELDEDLGMVEEDLYCGEDDEDDDDDFEFDDEDEDDEDDDDEDDDDEIVVVTCPGCGDGVYLDDTMDFDEIKCPSCGATFSCTCEECESCDGCDGCEE